MPLTRYQIRNEYGLADRELYRAADKDDPEALLEGVAMAGLVGVLRQLGDLAEFAAEIFHDLHEEVMATAARGHSLMARVQQLEAEFPSVEKAFLAQTDQTPFFTNAGVDGHPNLHMEQNLITRGDLPRFVMESYEECQGTPRLFLLDKFDVAGAGACLKRYTDPSVFKVEAVSFGVTAVEAQREKKNRKLKKKARWRNGETPEFVQTSHAKLHRLFLEERIENGHSDHARLVKLKRRQFNGFPFDPKPGKSYMERFLGTPSPERKEVHEVSVNSLPLRLTLNSSDERGSEIVEIGAVSPEKKSSLGRKNSCSSPIAEEAELKPVKPELNGETFGREIVMVPGPICGGEADDSAYFIYKREMENGLAVEEDRETEGSLEGDGSDDFMSEVENYMDALTTVESEMETDNEYKPKTDMGFLMLGSHVANSDAIDEHLDVRADFSDSQSIGNSSMSDDGKSMSRKGRSSFYFSDSFNNFAENTPSDNEGAAKVYTLEDGGSKIVGSPVDRPSVHSVNQGNESTELTCIEEFTAGKAAPSFPTVNSTVVSLARTELDEIPSDYTEFCSKSSYTDQKGIDLADSAVSHVPPQTLDSDNSLAEDRVVEELDHKYLDMLVSTDDVSDLEVEVDDGSVNKVLQTEYLDRNYDKMLVEGKIGSPQSVTSLVSVNEEHQADYAGFCDKDMIEGEVGSMCSVIFPSQGQPPSSVFLKSNVDSGVKPLSGNSDFLQPVQMNSEGSNAVTGKLIDSENLTETLGTPELDSIDKHLCSGTTLVEHDLGGAIYPENAKRFEEISRAIKSEQMDACTDKLDIEGEDSILYEHPVTYSDKSGSGPMNVDKHVDAPLVTVAVTTSAKYGVNDASCLPVDSVGSNSGGFVNIIDYLDGKELHQNETDYNGFLPECLMEPEEQKITRQPESVSTELKSSSYESTSDGSSNPEVLDHIHRPHLTCQAESSSCFSDVTAVPSSGLSNQGTESKRAYLNHSKDACEDVMPSPAKASLEHRMGLLAGQSCTESALVALDETNSESLKLQDSQCNISDSRTPEESLELLPDRHDFGYLQVDDTSSKSLALQSDKTQIASDMGQERCLDASSKQQALPSQELLVPSAVHEHCDTAISRNPFDSASPSFGLVLENLEEMPPLPPLPPMQWRMGKSQPPSLASLGQCTDHGKSTFLPMQPFIVDEKPQFYFLSVGREAAHSPNPFLSITSDIPKSQHLSVESPDNSIQLIPLSSGMPTSVTDESSQLDFLPVEAMETLNPKLKATNERQVGGFCSSGRDPVESSHDTSSTVATELNKRDPLPSLGSQTKLLNQVIPEPTSEAKESENSSQILAVDEQNYLEKSVLPPTTSEDQPHRHLVTVHGQTTWPSTLALPPTYEVGKPNGSKLPWPRNPLIDAVAAHDKSKLRKVTERAHAQVAPKADERDSLLEQIRTKSFNLRPTAVARHSIQGIQGPKSNLKVAAILEKANAIRQALTGSDEDEDTDSWSDS